jgi:hypothetical protein
MSSRLSSPYKPLLFLFIGLLLVGAHVVKAQNASPSPGLNASPSPSASASPSPSASPSATKSPAQTASDGNGKSAGELYLSYLYPIVVSLLFGVPVIGFALVLMRAIRYSKFTYHNPLGLPDGTFRDILAFMLVSFLGLYIFSSIINVTEFKPPESLLGIIATVIGFYFGSRSAEARQGDKGGVGGVGGVEGTVLTNAGSPAAGATVDLSQSGNKKFTQTADPSGKFRFDHVPSGDYDIQASLAGQTPSDPAKVKVTAGSTQTVSLKLK